MEDQIGPQGNLTLIHQIHRMLTQLQTQLSVISMHCGEVRKLCMDRADPRKVDMKSRVLKDEEKEIRTILKELLDLKGRLKYSDQLQLDSRLRPISEEYSSILQRFKEACSLGNEYCAQVRSMSASQLRSSVVHSAEPPREIALQNGQTLRLLAPEDDDEELAGDLVDTQLERDIGQLSEMFHLLLDHTTDQGHRIDTLEAHMEAANAEAHQAAIKMTQAAKLSAAVIPFAAALVGGAVGGPLGMLAGLKGASAATAAIGMGAGYFTGAWYRRRVQASADAAREELEIKTK